MGRKKRLRKHTVYGCVEGNRERAFLDHLRNIYDPEANNIKLYSEEAKGGGADSIVISALQNSYYDKSFVWFDEDFEPKSPLSADVRLKLADCWNIKEAERRQFLECPLGELQKRFNPDNKKPVLIVSQPVCCESLILRILGQRLPYAEYIPTQRRKQIDTLKKKLDQLMGGLKLIAEQTAYYEQYLSKEMLEEKRKTILELDLLILMITK